MNISEVLLGPSLYILLLDFQSINGVSNETLNTNCFLSVYLFSILNNLSVTLQAFFSRIYTSTVFPTVSHDNDCASSEKHGEKMGTGQPS